MNANIAVVSAPPKTSSAQLAATRTSNPVAPVAAMIANAQTATARRVAASAMAWIAEMRAAGGRPRPIRGSTAPCRRR
jgi:hypothetical protein